MVAPGMEAPLGSVTVPVSDAVNAWPNNRVEARSAAKIDRKVVGFFLIPANISILLCSAFGSVYSGSRNFGKSFNVNQLCRKIRQCRCTHCASVSAAEG